VVLCGNNHAATAQGLERTDFFAAPPAQWNPQVWPEALISIVTPSFFFGSWQESLITRDRTIDITKPAQNKQFLFGNWKSNKHRLSKV
jgi:hypothetical protein